MPRSALDSLISDRSRRLPFILALDAQPAACFPGHSPGSRWRAGMRRASVTECGRIIQMTPSARPSRWVWPLLSIHLLFLGCEIVSLLLRGHFHVSNRVDLARAIGIGAAGYGLIFALEALAFYGTTRLVRFEPGARRAVQLGLTTLTTLLLTDHVGRHWIDSPFATRSILLLSIAIAVSVTFSWLLALGIGRLFEPTGRLMGPLPVLALTGLFALLLVWFPRTRESARLTAAAGRPNVILISIDTARADYFSSYGFAAPSTPALDRIAARGVRFTRAFSPENWTLPAHASMLTSLYPPTHGVEDLDSRLADGIPTLAELYADSGYRTLGIVDGDRRSFVGASRGFDQGFEHYVHYPDGKGVQQAFLPFRAHSDVNLFFEKGHSDEIVRSAIRWIEQTPLQSPDSMAPQARPFFLFLHVYDAHASWGARWPIHRLPYQAHQELLTQLGISDELRADHFLREGMTGARYLRALNRALETGIPQDSLVSPSDVALLQALYASSLHFVDSQIAILDRFLEEAGILDSTILLVTSDHGEEFGEHGRFGHHQDYRETLHIPLLLRWPEQIETGQVHEIVGTTDLAPTLLELCGIRPPDAFQGRSLVPLLKGDDWMSSATFMGNQLDGIFGVRTARFSYYVHGLREARAVEELFDVEVDSLERVDLRPMEPAELDSARSLVAEWLHRALQARPPAAGPANPLDTQTRALLRSLGYIN